MAVDISAGSESSQEKVLPEKFVAEASPGKANPPEVLTNTPVFAQPGRTSDYMNRLVAEGAHKIDLAGDDGIARLSSPVKVGTNGGADDRIRVAQASPEERSGGRQGDSTKNGFREVEKDKFIDEKTGLEIQVRGASPEFRDKMLDVIRNLPEADRQRLAAAGTKIAIVGKNSDYFTAEEVKQNPRGHNPGTTWDDLSGGYHGDTNTVVVAENRNKGPNPNPAAVLKHESGHAIDRSLGEFHNTPEFIEAYKKDVAAMSEGDKKKYQYDLQKGPDGSGQAGRDEAFANVYSALRGDSVVASAPYANNAADHLRKFPHLAALIKRRLERRD